jgi:hypothetical protein
LTCSFFQYLNELVFCSLCNQQLFVVKAAAKVNIIFKPATFLWLFFKVFFKTTKTLNLGPGVSKCLQTFCPVAGAPIQGLVPCVACYKYVCERCFVFKAGAKK